MVFKIYQSPDWQVLAECFVASLQEVRFELGVFDSAMLVVPDMAVREFVEKELTESVGVSASLSFFLFREFEFFCLERFAKRLGVVEEKNSLSGFSMRWRLLAFLWAHYAVILEDREHALYPSLSQVVRLGEDEDAILRGLWLYASEMARIFSLYIELRPEWLRRFVDDVEDLEDIFDVRSFSKMPDWLQEHYQEVLKAQCFLWRTVFAEDFRAQFDLRTRFLEAKEAVLYDEALKYVFVFLPDSFAPSLLEFLKKLAEFTNVYVFHHTVSNAFFSEVKNAHWLRQLSYEVRERALLSSGHEWASRFLYLPRERFRVLEACGLSEALALLPPAWQENGSLLRALQQDIYRLDDEVGLPDRAVDDDSLRVHACQGLLRQLEVLRAEIVRWLNEDSSRNLDDILIVVDDLQEVQDTVRAVFPLSGDYDGYAIPARITGVASADAENLWKAVGGIYELAVGDFTASEVREWLLLADNCVSYGVSHETMFLALNKLQEAGFRRGFDEAHLSTFLNKEDGDYRFSFSYALDRLLCAYVLDSDDLFLNCAPFDYVSFDLGPALNALAQFAEDVALVRAQYEKRYTPLQALEVLEERLNERYGVHRQGRAWQSLQQCMRDVFYQFVSDQGALQPSLPLRFMVHTVGESLLSKGVSAEPTGVINITRLEHALFAPYRLVAFVFGESQEFPKRAYDKRYNLLDVAKKALGDYRAEHRALASFLNLLMSARENCWFFYNGQSATGENLTAPMPVRELLRYFQDVRKPSLSEDVLKHHEPSPFYPDEHRTHPAPLWKRVREQVMVQKKAWLDDVDCAINTQEKVDFIDFERFYYSLRAPYLTFLRAQQVEVYREASSYSDLPALEINGLDNWCINQKLWRYWHDEDLEERMRVLPVLPVGKEGRRVYWQNKMEIQERVEYLEKFTQRSPFLKLEKYTIDLGDVYLSVSLPESGNSWPIFTNYSSSPRHLLRFYLQHLAWQCLDEKGQSVVSFSSKNKEDSVVIFPEMVRDEAHEALKLWWDLYQTMHSRLLFITPEWIEKLRKTKEENLNREAGKMYEEALVVEEWKVILSRMQKEVFVERLLSDYKKFYFYGGFIDSQISI